MSCCGAYNVMMVCFLWWCHVVRMLVYIWYGGGGGVICAMYGSLYMYDHVYSDIWYV